MSTPKTQTRTHLELVPADNSSLTAIQAKINQWITTGLLIKFDVIPNTGNFLFRILLKKQP